MHFRTCVEGERLFLKNKFGAILDYIDSNEMKQKLVSKVLKRHIYILEWDP